MKTIEAGCGYLAQGGEVRHVINISRCGRGHRVTWDSISGRHPNYYCDLYRQQKHRPHGIMAMRDFQKWALSKVTQ